MKTRGKDVLTRKQIRAELVHLNEVADGSYDVAIVLDEDGNGVVSYPGHGEVVVTLPGDGLPFPVAAYTEALLVSRVVTEET